MSFIAAMITACTESTGVRLGHYSLGRVDADASSPFTLRVQHFGSGDSAEFAMLSDTIQLAERGSASRAFRTRVVLYRVGQAPQVLDGAWSGNGRYSWVSGRLVLTFRGGGDTDLPVSDTLSVDGAGNLTAMHAIYGLCDGATPLIPGACPISSPIPIRRFEYSRR
jgi:hypothetical protein